MLETVLTGRNLLSPVLASASRDVVAFNSTVATAQGKAAASVATSAKVQDSASDQVVRSNTRASTSAATSANVQSRAHAKAAESATLSARVQETANRSLAASNGLLGTSLTPLTAGLSAVGLGLAYAGYRGMEFGTAMSQVQAASQASAADLNLMRDAAVKAGADTQYSAVEAAQGITEMSKAGVSAKDVLGGGLKGALNLAAAGQMEVADAAETGATALSVFNLRGDQMAHVADLLAAGAGKAQGSVHDMSAALNQSALVANQTGLSIEDTAGALAMFASNGLIGSDAGTSFKTMLQALTPNSKQAAEAMAAIGFSAYDSQGAFVGMESVAAQLRTGLAGLSEEQRNTTLETIFGSDAVRAASVLYKEGAQGVDEWTGKVNDAGYAQRQATQLTDNLRGDLERLGGAFDSTMTSIGSGTQGALREAVQALTAIVNVGGDVIAFWNSLPGPIQAGIVALAGVAALKGPVSSTLETIALKAMYMRDSVAGASIGMGGLKTAGAGVLGFFGGPWGLAITGATVGLSLLVSWLGRSDEATTGLADAQQTLTSALQATNGVIDDSVRRTAAKVLQDENLLKFTELYGVSSQDMVGYILGEADAHDRVTGSLQRYRASLEEKLTGDKDADIVTRGLIGAVDDHIAVLDGLATGTDSQIAKERELAVATGQTGGAMQASTAQTEEAAKALEDWLNRVGDISGSFAEPLAIYSDMLAAKNGAESDAASTTKAMTDSGAASWNEYAESVGISLDEYATKLEEHILAQENWRANIVAVTQRGGLEVGQALLDMGEEGALITAQMADATDAEFRRMADLLIRDAQVAGNGSSRALDDAMKVMAIVGRDGAKATRQGIADELNIGVGVVQGIANQYGINLATGINPILRSLGKPIVVPNQQAGRRYAGPNEFYDGGYTGAGDKYEPKGVVHGGEYVFTKEETERAGVANLAALAQSLRGYAAGGFVTPADVPMPRSTAPYRVPISTAGDATMQKGYDETRAFVQAHMEPPAAAGGSSTGLIPIMAAARQYVMDTYGIRNIGGFARRNIIGTNTLSDHGMGKAIDIMTTNLPLGWAIANDFAFGPAHSRFRAENVIWQQSISSNGGRFTGMADRGSPTQNHRDHVHVDTYDQGGLARGQGYLPKATIAPERVLDPRQTVAFEEWMRSPAAMPGYGAAASGGSFGGSVVVVNIEGAQITGTLAFDAGGLLRLVDGRVVTGITTITERGRHNP